MSVVAIVPAHDRADSIDATVRALLALEAVDRVLVVDDGSADDTGDRALEAGADVLRLPANCGKGGAVAAAVAATPSATTYLLVDADVGSTAALANALLPPVLGGTADLAVAVLPGAAGRGGFGAVRELARRGILTACGYEARAPLSGQRAIDARLLRRLTPAARFGLETAMTIDAVRAGARIVELDVAMEHRHTGRSLAGFRHRARQGLDITRALWPRVTSRSLRMGLMAACAAVLAVIATSVGGRWEPASRPAPGRPQRVVVFGMPTLSWSDLGSGRTPNLDRLVRTGAVAAANVRTASSHPSTAEAYASLGASARLRVPAGDDVALASPGPDSASPAVVVPSAASLTRSNRSRHLSSVPGALGEALERAGRRTAVVSAADTAGGRDSLGPGLRPARPAALAVMDHSGVVGAGAVGPELLALDASAPSGVRADPSAVVAATRRALAAADVVVVDPGDLDRAAALAPFATTDGARSARAEAVGRTDAVLGAVADAAGARALVLVVGLTPPGGEWRTTPLVASGPGIPAGLLHSTSVRRLGVVTLADVAPTILDSLGVRVPTGMVGHPLRYHPGDGDLGRLRRLDRDAVFRERVYFPITLTYIILQSLVYLLVILVVSRFGGLGRRAPVVRLAVLAVVAWPLATFALRIVPGVAVLGAGAVGVLLVVDAAIVAVAQRARRHPLSALAWILSATVVLLCADLATGARLETSSILGYSLHTAARFTGIGNTGFAVLAAATVLVAGTHIRWAPRRAEALVAVAALFALVLVFDGAPTLGDDVGGILTLVPILALLWLVLAGRRPGPRMVLGSGLATVAVVAVAAAADLRRRPEARTHLGRILTSGGAHGSTFLTTLQRRLSTNLAAYTSAWEWLIVVIAIVLVYLVARTDLWRGLLPKGGPLRAAVIAALAVGLLGNALNDSGAVVTALVFVFVGPMVTLLAIERERGGPVLHLAATPGVSPGVSPPLEPVAGGRAS